MKRIENSRFSIVLLAVSLLVPSFAVAQEDTSLKARTLKQLNTEMRLIRSGSKAALKKARGQKLTEKESQDLTQFSNHVGGALVTIGLLSGLVFVGKRYLNNRRNRLAQQNQNVNVPAHQSSNKKPSSSSRSSSSAKWPTTASMSSIPSTSSSSSLSIPVTSRVVEMDSNTSSSSSTAQITPEALQQVKLRPRVTVYRAPSSSGATAADPDNLYNSLLESYIPSGPAEYTLLSNERDEAIALLERINTQQQQQLDVSNMNDSDLMKSVINTSINPAFSVPDDEKENLINLLRRIKKN